MNLTRCTVARTPAGLLNADVAVFLAVLDDWWRDDRERGLAHWELVRRLRVWAFER